MVSTRFSIDLIEKVLILRITGKAIQLSVEVGNSKDHRFMLRSV